MALVSDPHLPFFTALKTRRCSRFLKEASVRLLQGSRLRSMAVRAASPEGVPGENLQRPPGARVAPPPHLGPEWPHPV